MTTPQWIPRASLALAAVALCVGGAVVLAPAQASIDQAAVDAAAVDAAAVDAAAVDAAAIDAAAIEAGTDDTEEAGWRITEHPGADLPTDPESLAAREIYPGTTLGELDYSAEEAEWALYQAPFGTAASAIETDFADDFAFAYFGPERSFTIGFTADAPAGALALLDGTGLPYSTIEAAGFTSAEYESAISAVGNEVTDRLDAADLLSHASGEGLGFMVGGDPTIAPGTIVITIVGADTDTRQDGMAAVAEVSADPRFTVSIVEGTSAMPGF
jgi:hypothetical protein